MKRFLGNLLASILGTFLSLLLIFFVIKAAVSGIGNDLEKTVSDNSVLTISLDEPIPENAPTNPLAEYFAELRPMPSLKSVADHIRLARTDNKITGIYLDLGIMSPALAAVEEIRNALIDFKKSGKFVYAYAEVYSQKAYYLASVADSIFINPQGSFDFTGFNGEQMFVKGLLSKLDIDAIVIKAGKYKSAGEMFTEDKMSAPNRLEHSEFINSVYEYYLTQIAKARSCSVAFLKDVSSKLRVKFPEDAVKEKLVDRAVYKDEVLALIKNKCKLGKEDEISFISLKDYVASQTDVEKYSSDKIALIYLNGDIGGGKGDPNRIGSEKLSNAIREAREDDHVKAIVLRINSPGGGALASDVIWREVVLAKARKPVIVSMGSVAASGGYYIAAPANTIVAEPTTITGSIGVFGLIPNLERFWKNKLGITYDRVKTGPYSDIGNPNRTMTEDEKRMIQTYIDTTYSVFKRNVAKGRNLPISDVDSLAQGRIYSGIQALKLGLVDTLGGLDDAIRIAVQAAHLVNYNLRIMPEYESGLKEAVSGMAQSKIIEGDANLQEYLRIKSLLENVTTATGTMMYCPLKWDIR